MKVCGQRVGKYARSPVRPAWVSAPPPPSHHTSLSAAGWACGPQYSRRGPPAPRSPRRATSATRPYAGARAVRPWPASCPLADIEMRDEDIHSTRRRVLPLPPPQAGAGRRAPAWPQLRGALPRRLSAALSSPSGCLFASRRAATPLALAGTGCRASARAAGSSCS